MTKDIKKSPHPVVILKEIWARCVFSLGVHTVTLQETCNSEGLWFSKRQLASLFFEDWRYCFHMDHIMWQWRGSESYLAPRHLNLGKTISTKTIKPNNRIMPMTAMQSVVFRSCNGSRDVQGVVSEMPIVQIIHLFTKSKPRCLKPFSVVVMNIGSEMYKQLVRQPGCKRVKYLCAGLCMCLSYPSR